MLTQCILINYMYIYIYIYIYEVYVYASPNPMKSFYGAHLINSSRRERPNGYRLEYDLKLGLPFL